MICMHIGVPSNMDMMVALLQPCHSSQSKAVLGISLMPKSSLSTHLKTWLPDCTDGILSSITINCIKCLGSELMEDDSMEQHQYDRGQPGLLVLSCLAHLNASILSAIRGPVACRLLHLGASAGGMLACCTLQHGQEVKLSLCVLSGVSLPICMHRA